MDDAVSFHVITSGSKLGGGRVTPPLYSYIRLVTEV